MLKRPGSVTFQFMRFTRPPRVVQLFKCKYKFCQIRMFNITLSWISCLVILFLRIPTSSCSWGLYHHAFPTTSGVICNPKQMCPSVGSFLIISTRGDGKGKWYFILACWLHIPLPHSQTCEFAETSLCPRKTYPEKYSYLYFCVFKTGTVTYWGFGLKTCDTRMFSGPI